jgi:hypothetical protein
MDINENIGESASELHKLLGKLFPVNSPTKSGERLKGLIYISENSPIQYSQNRDLLKTKFGTDDRQNLHNWLDDLEELDLIIRESNQIHTTTKGHKLVDGFRHFARAFSGQQTRSSREDIDEQAYYDRVEITLYTNGETHAGYLWEWELVNNKSDPIESLRHSVKGGGTDIGELELNHSDTVSNYEINVDRSDLKEFDIQFYDRISPESSVYYWYSYKLPGNYKPGWGDAYTFRFNCRTLPVKNLEINIINDNRYQIPSSSLNSFIEIGGGQNIFASSFTKEFRRLRMDDFTILEFRANNITSKSVVELQWDYEYEEVS